jgi:hypothetical protein
MSKITNPGELILGKMNGYQSVRDATSPVIRIGDKDYWLEDRTVGKPNLNNQIVKWNQPDIRYDNWAYLRSLHDLIVAHYPEHVGKDIWFAPGLNHELVIMSVRDVYRQMARDYKPDNAVVLHVGGEEDHLYLLADWQLGRISHQYQPLVMNGGNMAATDYAKDYVRKMMANRHPEHAFVESDMQFVKFSDLGDIGDGAKAMGANPRIDSTDLYIKVIDVDGKPMYYNDRINGIHEGVPTLWPANMSYWVNQKYDEIMATLLANDKEDGCQVILQDNGYNIIRHSTLGEYKSKLPKAPDMSLQDDQPEPPLNLIGFHVTDETGERHQYDPAQLAKYIKAEHQYTPKHSNCAKEIINRLLAVMVTRLPMLHGEGVLYNAKTGEITYSNTTTNLLNTLKAEEIQGLTRRHAKANFDSVYEGDNLGQLDVSDCLTHVQRQEAAQRHHITNQEPMVLPTDLAAANLPGPLGRSRKQQEDTDPGIKELRSRGVGINVWNDLNVPDQHLAEAFLESVNYDPTATYESPLEKERIEHMQKSIFGGPGVYKFPESLFTQKLDGVVPKRLLDIQRALSGNNDLFKATHRDAQQRLHDSILRNGGPLDWLSNVGPRGTSTPEDADAFIKGLFEQLAFITGIENAIGNNSAWANAFLPKPKEEPQPVKQSSNNPSSDYLASLIGGAPNFGIFTGSASHQRGTMFEQMQSHRGIHPDTMAELARKAPRPIDQLTSYELSLLAEKHQTFRAAHEREPSGAERTTMIQDIISKRLTKSGGLFDGLMAHVAKLTGGEITDLGDGRMSIRLPEHLAKTIQDFIGEELVEQPATPNRSDVQISLASKVHPDRKLGMELDIRPDLRDFVDLSSYERTDETGVDFRNKLILTYAGGQVIEVTDMDLDEMLDQADTIATTLGYEGEPVKVQLIVS